MSPQTTTWNPDTLRRVRALAFVLLCFGAGCHSIPLASMMADHSQDEAVLLRVSFGQPAVAPEVTLPTPIAALKNIGADESVQPIDLGTALRLAGADNPTIAIAEEAVRIRLAEQMQARALLFPTLDIGANLRLHRGNFINGRGVVTDVNIQSLYWGLGADAKGGGAVAVPGLRLVTHLGDAIYTPQAVQQQVVQSRFDATATRNNVLLEVGVRYLALVEAQARLDAYRESAKDFEEIERLTANFAKTGQGREADAQRARAETLLLRAEAERSREDIGVAAAELARLLDVDPSRQLRGADRVPPLLEMVDRQWSLQQLLDQALTYHPEISARGAEVYYQEIRLRQERVRPWLPVIAVGFSAGEFGGSGPDTKSRLGSFSPRTDLDVVAVWSLQNLGVGNRAGQNVVRSGLEQAQLERVRLFDRIRREVVEAHTLAESRRQEMELARKGALSAQQAYTQDLIRAKNNQGRPIEVLSSARQLAAARQDLVRAMIGFSQAQLQLYVALGNPPTRPK